MSPQQPAVEANGRPPKPRLALTVGAIGHRLRRKPGAEAAFEADLVRAAIDRVLDTLQATLADAHRRYAPFFDEREPLLALVTSLGDGADRIFAAAAAARGIPFDAILPFARDDYEQTFDDDNSRAQFSDLLAQARAILTLPAIDAAGSEEARARSYEQAAMTVLAQSDILLAVWDGEPAGGKGGTGQTVDDAAQEATPLVTIDPTGHPAVRASRDADFPIYMKHATDLPRDTNIEMSLARVVHGLVRPPDLDFQHVSRAQRIAERLRRLRLASIADLFERQCSGDAECEGLRVFQATPTRRRWRHKSWRRVRYALLAFMRPLAPGVVPDEPPGITAALLHAPNDAAHDRLQRAYDDADAVGNHYADAFRSAYILNFLFGALALFSVAASLHELTNGRAWPAISEIACIALLAFITLVAKRRQWRRRWYEAREAAERLRLAVPFWIIGIWPHALSSHQPAWTGWYVRSILREQPVFSGDHNSLLGDAKTVLASLLREQMGYHVKSKREAEHMNRALEHLGIAAVALTLAVSLTHILSVWAPTLPTPLTENWRAVLSVIFPAVATACFGIRMLSDFEDTALRSQRTIKQIERLLGLMKDDPETLTALRTRARQAAAVMLADVANWRVSVESRNISV